MSASATPRTREKTRSERPATQAKAEVSQGAALLEAVRREVVHQAEARPYTTVLVAAAAGYVLGVGTPRWLTRLAMNTAGRAMVASVVNRL